MNLSTKQKQTHKHGEHTVATKGDGERVEWIRSLELIDAHYYI